MSLLRLSLLSLSLVIVNSVVGQSAYANSYQESSMSGYKLVQPDFEKLATAIYMAEGGSKAAHPYGIMTHFKTTTPRQACLNTLRHRWREWAVLSPNKRLAFKEGFLRYLQASYSPLGAKNDHLNLNVNWYNNVRGLYGKLG